MANPEDNLSSRFLEHQFGELCDVGLRKENQDVVLGTCYPEGDENPEVIILACYDGHGSNGKVCAETTNDIMAKELTKPDNNIVKAFIQDSDTLEAELSSLFNSTQEKIAKLTEDKSSKVSARFSGTTVALTLIKKNKICVANVGDSDVVIGGIDSEASTTEKVQTFSKMINTRHQLNVEEEKQRVEEAGGRVEAQRARNGTAMNGPLRVWLKEVQTPGLMVSRSIGDLVCHDIGVIADPSVHLYDIEPNHTVIIQGSDGLWEFVKPDEAVAFVEDFVDPVEAARGLTFMALCKQEKRNADNVSVQVYFLESKAARQKRLEASQNYDDIYKARLNEIEEFERLYQEKQNGGANPAPQQQGNGNGNAATGAANGSILYGDPAAGSVVAGSIVGSDLEEKQEKQTETKKSSKACVIQ